jgi:hypothetical protein
VTARVETPVALFVYNRPELTARVVATLREAQPSRLLVVADGPKADRMTDPARCAAARAVATQLDWPCELRTHFADQNLGLKRRMESGLDWVFDQTDEAIILEDDCLPSRSFYRFCEELLKRYRHDERVLTVSGTCFLFDQYQPPHSYFFSRYPLIWGWATWRRAWRKHDPTMAAWPACRESGFLERFLESAAARRYWTARLELNRGRGASWDYAWILSCWLADGLSAVPSLNLVRNVGFGDGATNTTDATSRFADLPVGELALPLRHPPAVERDAAADLVLERTTFSGEHFLRPLFSAARRHTATARRA